MITVKNIKDGISDDDIYIGRTNKRYGLIGSPLCNPYKLTHFSREESIRRYTTYLLNHCKEDDNPIYIEIQRLVNLIKEGKDINLVCWCHPLPCHGDIIKKVVEKLYEYSLQREDRNQPQGE